MGISCGYMTSKTKKTKDWWSHFYRCFGINMVKHVESIIKNRDVSRSSNESCILEMDCYVDF